MQALAHMWMHVLAHVSMCVGMCLHVHARNRSIIVLYQFYAYNFNHFKSEALRMIRIIGIKTDIASIIDRYSLTTF